MMRRRIGRRRWRKVGAGGGGRWRPQRLFFARARHRMPVTTTTTRKESPPTQKIRTWAELAAQSSRAQASSDDAPARLERVIGNVASERAVGSAEGEHIFFFICHRVHDSNEKSQSLFFFFSSPSLSVENVPCGLSAFLSLPLSRPLPLSFSLALSYTRLPEQRSRQKRSSRSLVPYLILLFVISSRFFPLSLGRQLCSPLPFIVSKSEKPRKRKKTLSLFSLFFTTCPRSLGRRRKTPRR